MAMDASSCRQSNPARRGRGRLAACNAAVHSKTFVVRSHTGLVLGPSRGQVKVQIHDMNFRRLLGASRRQ
jgi:hypothetical protein